MTKTQNSDTQYIALIRALMPNGPNSIPKMEFLREIITEVGFSEVRTYIQSGNIVLRSSLDRATTAQLIHTTIKERIGAELQILVFTPAEIATVLHNNPFIDEKYPYQQLNAIICSEPFALDLVGKFLSKDFGAEEVVVADNCIYTYLPQGERKRKVASPLVERHFKVSVTMRKLQVLQRLVDMCDE